MTTNDPDVYSPTCVCCDGKGWQLRNDGIRVPCPGCEARWEQITTYPYCLVPTYTPAPVVPTPDYPWHPLAVPWCESGVTVTLEPYHATTLHRWGWES